ncbi:uncharacterized protein K452DRAFT_208528, partial [Aplosporella prunicola CBS 121167]
HETIATVPVNQYNDSTALSRFSPPPFSEVPEVTQPTQILDTPIAARTDPNSIVQVAASSPLHYAQPSSSPPSKLSMAGIAPPGTIFRPPPRARPTAKASFDDDPPVADSSEDELSKADIKPSSFSRRRIADIAGDQAPSAFKQIMSQFEFKGSGSQKRPADDSASAYAAGRRRPQQPPRQQGPARAQPVEITMDDIPDFELQQKVKRMQAVYPHVSITTHYNALLTKKGNFDDAMVYVCELEDKEQASKVKNTIDLTSDDDKPQPIKPKNIAKREVKTTKSIQDKWGSTQTAKRDVAPSKSIQEKWSAKQPQRLSDFVEDRSSPVESSPPKTRRRLVQGRKSAAPLTSEPGSPEKPVVKPAARKPITIESDDESDPGVETAEEEEEEDLELEGNLLNFLNTCPAKELADISNQTIEIAEGIIARRPFKNLDQVRRIDLNPPTATTKAGKKKTTRKPIGEKVMDICEEMWTGYEAIDELVAHCNGLAKPLAAEMKRWGINVSGAAKEGGELNLLSLEEAKSEKDSGIGTPSSSAALDEEEDGDIKITTRKPQFLQKPSVMAVSLILKDYQIVGLNWLNLLWSKKLSCILADDMGLGKTCQVISFLSHLYETGASDRPHLVIVPGSTLENWLREFKSFSPKLVVEPYYGSQKEREELRMNIEENIDNINVIVTTYDTACRNSADNKFLRNLKPTVCVYDEAHVLRNSESKRYNELMRIPAEFRLLLTGTPLQNNLQELVSLLAFLMPNIFKEQKENLQYIFKNKAKTTDANHAALLSKQRIERARIMMTPFILRRKKQQVLKHLPPKTCRVEYCDLVPSQKAIYEGHLERQRKVLEDRLAGRPNQEHANVMMKLRQAAIHPLLFRRIYDDEKLRKMVRLYVKEFPDRDPDLVYEDLEWRNDFDISKICEDVPSVLGKYVLKDEEWMDSGKVKKLVELLQGFQANGDRALIFSQFTMVMDVLEAVLNTIDMPFFRMDGGTPIAKRQDMLDEFYRDTSIPVFMLSTRSGGAGINLACANKVIIFDSSFNPQDDIQAENRAHRVGQKRAVDVVRLVTRGTIEEQIHALGESKLALDERVAGAAGGGEAEESAKKEKEGGALSKAEEEGVDLVERMMLEDLK